MKKTSIFSIILFLFLLAVPLLAMNRKANQTSPLDNTVLPEWEDVVHGGDAMLGLESYLTARIGFRTNMIDAYLNLNDRLFGVLHHPTYTYGREGYIFFHMREEVLDEEYLDVFTDFVGKLEGYCKKNGMTFLYCMNPNKSAVYTEYLPNGVHFTFPRQEYLVKRLQEKGVRYLDNTSALTDAKDEMQVFNVKYDAGHWNDNGAFVGMANIIEELRKDHPNVPSLSKDMFTISEETMTYMPLSNFVINDVAPVYTRINQQAVPVTDYNADLKLHEEFRDFTYYKNPNGGEGLPKILIFRGSYFLGREKFMADHFSEAVFIHSYHNILNYEYYLELFKPDVVLFESVEYATKNRYFPLKKMKKAVK